MKPTAEQNAEARAGYERWKQRRADCVRDGHQPLGDTCTHCGANMNVKGRRGRIKGKKR